MTNPSLKESIIERQNIINSARIALKKEFIGIDNIIDQILEYMSSWYLFPVLQGRPLIINLWGLTGVGKTSLIKRLAKLLDYEKMFFHLELGNIDENENSFFKKIKTIHKSCNNEPVFICLDEFQYMDSLDNDRGLNKTSANIIWEILDSGEFQLIDYEDGLYDLKIITISLKTMLRLGYKVEKGIVTNNSEGKFELDFDKYYGHSGLYYDKNDNTGTRFIPLFLYNQIDYLLSSKYESKYELEKLLFSLNGEETIEFLKSVYEQGKAPKTINLTKAIIFILGNLDEAYHMAGDFNPDINADEFHRQSLKITVTDVKAALRLKFRNEQIARLGNIHIIYPAFTKKSFENIIRLELNNYSISILEKQNLNIKYDESVVGLIYREGAYPTQGTRPIYTTINQIIKSKLGKIIAEMYLKNIEPDLIKVSSIKNQLIVTYFKNNKQIHTLVESVILNLENLRENKKDDCQAISAVHESGHAIIVSKLLNIVPEYIFSNTTINNTAGFTYTKLSANLISKNEIIKRAAFYLGGIAAEKIVFGEENITSGSSTDIYDATEFVSQMLKNCGMGGIKGAYQNRSRLTNFYIYDEESVNIEIKEYLKNGLALAEQILKEEELLLLKMSDHLSDNRMLVKTEILKYISNYAKAIKINSDNNIELFYRNNLKRKLSKYVQPVLFQTVEQISVSLNKNK